MFLLINGIFFHFLFVYKKIFLSLQRIKQKTTTQKITPK